jgi:hypothetical protein
MWETVGQRKKCDLTAGPESDTATGVTVVTGCGPQGGPGPGGPGKGPQGCRERAQKRARKHPRKGPGRTKEAAVRFLEEGKKEERIKGRGPWAEGGKRKGPTQPLGGPRQQLHPRGPRES